MTIGGRNDPCPCGSGRKYKECCSGGEEARLAVLTASTVRESSIAKLLSFAFQPAFDSDHSIAEVIFWGDLLRNAAPHELQWLMDSEDANIKYNAWFLFDWDADGQGTAADLFLEDPHAQLSVAERQFLGRLSRANLRLYEVEGVDRGRGVRLLDLWTGVRLFVIERTATSRIVTWDLLGARVAPDGIGGNVFEGGLYLFPAEAKARVVTHFRRLFRRHQRKYPHDDSGAFFRRHGMVFNHLWLDLVAFPEPPQLVTAEGDPLIFCRAVFETPHLAEVRRAIVGREDVRPAADGRFAWIETTAGGERAAGTWSFEEDRVVLETTSQARAARGRAWLETLAGDRVRYRATALETIEQTMEEIRRPRPRAKADESPLPADVEAVQELYDRHYRSWLDRPEPTLGHRTPRAAARTRLWRSRLVDLLKQLENSVERAALQGRPGYDFRWLWAELGVQRPPG
ncbi:MAG: SEC-C domain-containing protein [Vicinamibacterales bacterium]